MRVCGERDVGEMRTFTMNPKERPHRRLFLTPIAFGIFAMSITWSVSLMWACDLAYHFSVPLHVSGPHRAVLYARADNRRRRVLIHACLLAIQATF